ncbi:MAG: hypothetical protein HDR80_04330 [Bacteroides sp.]|nr:hypothetical protein [Bacteroides sp.]
MAKDLSYDDSNLQGLFRRLDPKERSKMFRKSFRRTANKVKKMAKRNLMLTGLHNVGQLSKGIRSMTLREVAGFRVTIRTKKGNIVTGNGRKGFHTNRLNKNLPILIWMEEGTEDRNTKKPHRVPTYSTPLTGRWATTGYRGFVRPYNFMDKTYRESRGPVNQMLQDEIRKTMTEIAKQYGCD